MTREQRRIDRCKRKEIYHTYNSALKAAIDRSITILEPLEAYQCQICLKYHIGHRKGWKKCLKIQEQT